MASAARRLGIDCALPTTPGVQEEEEVNWPFLSPNFFLVRQLKPGVSVTIAVDRICRESQGYRRAYDEASAHEKLENRKYLEGMD